MSEMFDTSGADKPQVLDTTSDADRPQTVDNDAGKLWKPQMADISGVVKGGGSRLCVVA